MDKHRWTAEDAILALDLFWRVMKKASQNSDSAESTHDGLFFLSTAAANSYDVESTLLVSDSASDSHAAKSAATAMRAEKEKISLWVGCSVLGVEKKLAEYQWLHAQVQAISRGASIREMIDMRAENPMRISSIARQCWEEFGSGLWFDMNQLRSAARRIIKQRDVPKKVSRYEARCAAMRVLYAAQMRNLLARDAWQQLREDENSARMRAVLDDNLLSGIVGAFDDGSGELLNQISAAAGRKVENISAVELATICAAMAEFCARPKTSRRLIINEAVEIAKQFGADGGHKIVNGVLDAALSDKPDKAHKPHKPNKRERE